MLTDKAAKRLMAMLKHFVDRSIIKFPTSGDYLDREVASDEGRESFTIDINRKGRVKITKCTFQERYAVTDILFRLDIDGPPHENPDGAEIPCPHLHVYREGYAAKWAFSLDAKQFTDTTNLVRTFREFLALCQVHDIPDIQGTIT